MQHTWRQRLPLALLTAGCLAAVTACGAQTAVETPSGAAATATSPAASSPPAEATAFPLTISNCDLEVTFEQTPARIVSMNDHVTEVLLALGAGDRIVGMGYADATPLPEFAEEWKKIPALGDPYATKEQLLDAEPDLVVGGMTSAFSEDEGRSRESLQQAGINTFKFTEYCGRNFSLDLLAEDYRQLGQILGVPDKAEALVASVVDPLEQIAQQVSAAEPVPTFLYDSGDADPVTVGGTGVGQLITSYAGGANIYSEGERPYLATTWETIVERNPQAILVLDYGETTAEQKIEFLKNQPLLKQTDAVKNDRFIALPLDDFFESPRLVRSVRTLAHFLHPELVPAP